MNAGILTGMRRVEQMVFSDQSEWDKKRMNDYYVITRQNMQMNTNGKNEWVNTQINEY